MWPTVPSPAPTMYLGLDGTGVPVRPAEVEGRRGEQPDGSAKTREVKLATVWTAEGRDKAGRPVRDRGSVSYNAAVESAASRDTDPLPSAFAQRAYREAQRRGFDTAARRVVIGDGAPWIWRVADEQFPGAIEIVDIYHAKQHLCDVAKAIYGAGTDLADQWARDRRAELDAGRLRAVVAALRIHVETTPEARRCIHYVFGNRHRMRYPQFRAKGLCISSGVVEAGCKQIGARFKRAGMRWTVAGANAIIALRCCILSGRFEDFWETRAANAAHNDVVHPRARRSRRCWTRWGAGWTRAPSRWSRCCATCRRRSSGRWRTWSGALSRRPSRTTSCPGPCCRRCRERDRWPRPPCWPKWATTWKRSAQRGGWRAGPAFVRATTSRPARARAGSGARATCTCDGSCARSPMPRARTHGVQFGPYKQQLAKRRGAGSAVVATAHKILRIVFAMLRDDKPYCDPQIVVDLHRPVRPDAPAVGGADAVDPNEYWQYCQNPCVFRVARLPVAVSCRGRCATSLP